MTLIHPTAIIDKKAELDSGVSVGPYSIIGPNVKIGKNTQIHSHVVLQGYTTLGEENQVFSFASIGNPPQDLKYKGEKTLLEIGSKNLIREYVTMQPGTVQGGGFTKVGDENLFMAYVHVAHDCVVGHQNVFANCAQLAGHVTIESMTVVGGLAAIHQFVMVGKMAMVAGGCMLKKDLPPFCIANGFRAVLRGLNTVALQRRNIPPQVRGAIKKVYKILFADGNPTVEDALAHISKEDLNFPEVQYLVDFVKNSKRGVTRPLSSLKSGDDGEE